MRALVLSRTEALIFLVNIVYTIITYILEQGVFT